MNQSIEDAVVGSLLEVYPNANIYIGKVIEGVQADDIIVNTVLDNVILYQGSGIRTRNIFIQVTVINPSLDIDTTSSNLYECLQEINANGTVHYPTTIHINHDDGKVQALANLTYMESTLKGAV